MAYGKYLKWFKSYVNVHTCMYMHITYVDVCLIGWIGRQWKANEVKY